MRTFVSHGNHTLRYIDNIIVSQSIGCFNLEEVQTLNQQIKELVEHINSPNWCRIIDLSLFELATPDATDETYRFAHWAKENGCLAYIFINSKSIHRNLSKRNYQVDFYFESDDFDDALLLARSILNQSNQSG